MDFLECMHNMSQPSELVACYKKNYDNLTQRNNNSPMPWVGMYVAAASASCSLAMAVDAFNGFRSKKFWFPCKYFSMNAFFLTVLAVTTKLSVDYSGNLEGVNEKLARISSLALMSTAMGNFMTSLASMENNEILLNMAALGFLVITIAANICIYITRKCYTRGYTVVEEIGSTALMLLLLLVLFSLATMAPSAKRYIELKYNEKHKRNSNKQVEWGESTVDELKIVVRRYWVMAATGSPQFVMARSGISGTSGLICLLVALTLVEAYVRFPTYDHFRQLGSNYKWSINWILYIQSIGVGLGTIIALLRWYVAAWFKISDRGQKSLREEFKIENYWASKLVEWRESPLPLQIRNHKCKRLLHDAKRLLLNLCIGVQILFVRTNKLVLLITATFGNAVFLCFHHAKNFKRSNSRVTNDMTGSESRIGTELDLSRYVLLLEGEVELPKTILKNICTEVDKLIQIGEEKQPKNLIKLLRKSVNFNGVREFDSNEVPSLHSQEPPNCWSLPVVSLTTIAIALPNITNDKANQLLSGVSEGLSLVKLIEKTLNRNGEIESIRNAADMVWVGVELYRKWQDKDLDSASLKGTTCKETLQKLSDIAEKTVKDFTTEIKDILMQNPLNWPVKIIANSSMYRVTQAILLAHKDDEDLTNEELFERLSIIISDILAACLTNLVHVITLKCHRNCIKERQESVSQAAILLGETEEIIEFLQQRDVPSLDQEKAANIDEWRAFMKGDSENPPATISTSNNNTANPQPNGGHVSIELEG